MKRKITALITALALSLQFFVFGATSATFAEAPATMSSVTLTPTDNDYISGIEVSVLDKGTSGEYILAVNATPVGFQYFEDNDSVIKFHKALVSKLSAYTVDGEMPDPSTLSDDKLKEIMDAANAAISADPELSAMSKFMSYSFTLPKEALVTSPDSSTDYADINVNCVTDKSIPYLGKTVRMGSYDITDDGNGNYKITISLDNAALWANPHDFNFGVSMEIDTNSTEISDVGLKNNGDVVEVSAEVVDNYIPVDPNTVAANFTVSKTAVSPWDTDDNTFVYTITAKALDGATLAGKVITDNGPNNSTNLSLQSAKLEGSDLPVSGISGNSVTYTFPDNSTATEATFTLVYKMNSSFISSMLDNNRFYIDGSNEVVLTDPDMPDLERKAQAWVGYNTEYMHKNGSINSANSKQIDWTVTINTKYTYSENIYLVDYLSKNHKYIEGSLTINGTPAALSGNDTVTNPVTALTVNADGTVNADTNKVLTYGEGSDAYEGFVIKLDNYGNPDDLDADNCITIKYSTLSNTEETDEVSFKNDYKLIYDKLYYGTDNKDSADEYENDLSGSAKVDVNYVTFTKSAQQYLAGSQKIKWNFEVNPKFTSAYENAVLTDIIPAGLAFTDGMILTGKISTLSSSSEITFTRYDSTAPDKTLVPKYSYFVDGSTITIGLGDIAANEKISLVLETKCVDGKLFSTVDTDNKWEYPDYGKYTNDATLSTYDGSNWTDTTDSANAEVWNDMLKKETNGAYNAEENTASWKITVNHYGLPIENLTLTELLPEGMTFAGIEKIEVLKLGAGLSEEGWNSSEPFAAVLTPAATDSSCFDAASGEYVNWWSVVSNTTANGYNQDTLTIKFNPGKASPAKYIVYLKSETTEKFRTEKLGTGESVQFKNTATVTGNIYGEDLSFTKTADITASYQRTEKYGEMVAGMNDLIKWTCKINKDKADFGGKWIVDDLSSVGLELVIDNSMYPMTLLADGVPVTGTELDKFALSINYTDFEFKIPDDYANKTLTLTFYTTIVSNASRVTNKLYIRNDGEEIKKEHSSSNEVDTDDYSYSAGASTSPNPKIVITKTDKVTGNAVAGVKFTASYTYNGKLLSKVGETDANGIAYITNLPKDTIITFEETTAASGYYLSSKKYKVVFLDTLTKDNFTNDVFCVQTNNITKPKLDISINNRPEGTPAEPEDVIVIKYFENTDLTTLPVAVAQSILDNTQFTIYNNAACLDENAVATGTLHWNSENGYAYAKFDTLTDVDTTYYIKETKTAPGYEGDTAVYEVVVDAEGLVYYKNSVGETGTVMPEITNKKLVVQKVEFEKLFENNDLSALSETLRNNLLAETKFTLYSDSACTTAVAEKTPVWNGTKALVTFDSGLDFATTYYIRKPQSLSVTSCTIRLSLSR